ncbi:MAG: protein kinase [Gemmatimonadaceae bacterium]
MPELVDQVLQAIGSRYRIERELSSGATALVCVARDLRHGRLVVLKVLRPEISVMLGAARFQREIEIVSRLSHPNILPLYDSAEANGLLYFVMPYVEGGSLRDRLDAAGSGTPLAPEEVLRIATRVARALEFAHAHGVVHRDVKPENIFLHEGEPVVADFGIAVALASAGGGERLTASGTSLGTPAYMSPEQAAADPVIDHRTDIYSLACVVFEMLTGRPPFVGSSRKGVIGQHLVARPPRLADVRPDLEPSLDVAIDRALAKTPDDRYPSMAEFGRALGAATSSGDVRMTSTTGGVSAVGVAPLWRRRQNALAAVAMLAVLCLIAAVAWRASRATGAMAASAKLRPHDWVIVADVAQPGPDRSLANVIYDVVTTELDQSQIVRTVSREHLAPFLAAASIPDTALIDEHLARNLAMRSDVRAVIVSGVKPVSATRYALVLRATSVANGEVLAAASGDATRDQLLDTARALARTLRERLGEERDKITAPRLASPVATPSIDAYSKYTQALRLSMQGDDAGSNQLAREAIALDTGFASAWALMANNYRNQRELDSSRLAFAEALRRPRRLSGVVLHQLQGDVAYAIDYDLPAAVRGYDLALNDAPRSTVLLNNKAFYLSLLGQYDEARTAFKLAAAQVAFGPAEAQYPLLNETAMLISLGRLDEARRTAGTLTGPYAQYGGLELASAAGEWARAESLAAAPLASPSTAGWVRNEARIAVAGALAARGAVRAADSALADASLASTGGQRHFFDYARLVLDGAFSTGAAASIARSSARDTTPGALVVRAIASARAGDAAGARRTLRRLQSLPAADLRRLGGGPRLITAELAAKDGRWADVTQQLDALAVAGEHDNANLDRAPSIMVRWLVAEAYARSGRTDTAASRLGLAMSGTRVPPGQQAMRGLIALVAELKLARWSAERGDSAESRRQVDAARAALRAPDAAQRILVDTTQLALEKLLAKRSP